MYIAFGNRVVDSNEFKNIIEENTEFKVLKDMSKGSKREDIVAFNISIDVDVLNEELSADFDINELSEDELFDEYMSMAEEIAIDIEESLPEDSIVRIAAYKWDQSDNDIKLVVVAASEELGEMKLNDVMKRLLTQVE